MPDLGKTGNSRYIGRTAALSLRLSLGGAESADRFWPRADVGEGGGWTQSGLLDPCIVRTTSVPICSRLANEEFGEAYCVTLYEGRPSGSVH